MPNHFVQPQNFRAQMMVLGLFLSAIQALIFATLAANYIGEALEEHGAENHD